MVVIDDKVAYCGGLDLTICRWDTPAHRVVEPLRCKPSGDPYGPFHDVQAAIEGEAARVLGELVRERLRAVRRRGLPKLKPVGDPWPQDVESDFKDVEVAVARTRPPVDESDPVREIAALYERAIGAAEKLVYRCLG